MYDYNQVNNRKSQVAREIRELNDSFTTGIDKLKELADPKVLWERTQKFASTELRKPRTLLILGGVVGGYFLLKWLSGNDTKAQIIHTDEDSKHAVVISRSEKGSFLGGVIKVAMETFVLYLLKNLLTRLLQRKDAEPSEGTPAKH